MNPVRLHDPMPFILHPKQALWELYKPLLYRVGAPNSMDAVTVSRGFITDFASIPRVVRFVFPQRQIVALPPVIHDWLYATHERSRQEADEIFYEAMLAAGYDPVRAYAQYTAVRVGGSIGYDETSPRQMRERTPKLFEVHYVGT